MVAHVGRGERIDDNFFPDKIYQDRQNRGGGGIHLGFFCVQP